MDPKLDRPLVILDSFSAKTENDICKEFLGVAAQKNGQFASGEQVPVSAPPSKEAETPSFSPDYKKTVT